MSTEDDRDSAVDEFVEGGAAEQHEGTFTLDEELRDAFGAPQVRRAGGHWTADETQLPTPIQDGDTADALAPPFLLENQVCIADRSAFVLRDGWGTERLRFRPDEVEQTPDGRYRVPTRAVAARISSKHGPENWRSWLLAFLQRLTRSSWIEVEPVRPPCRHYVEQLEPPAPSQAHVIKQGDMHRYCAARRNMAGAFMGLKDSAMKACSLRDPYDVSSDRLLQKFDQDLLEKSSNREWFPMFDLVTNEVAKGTQQKAEG